MISYTVTRTRHIAFLHGRKARDCPVKLCNSLLLYLEADKPHDIIVMVFDTLD